ncbi:MAG: hypothetical protein AB8H86_05245 [Polyangiales bacterium]
MIRLSLLCTLVALLACGDDDGGDAGLRDTGTATADSGPVIDASAEDASSEDAGAADAGSDAGPLPDAGPVADGGASTDAATPDAATDAGAGTDSGPSMCDGVEIGNACATPRDCSPRTHACVEGQCRPTERLGCTSPDMTCASRTTPRCVLPVGSRTGFCVTMEEALCVCSEHTDAYNCR